MTIQGSQKGTPIGKQNPDSEHSFDARHDAMSITFRKYINKLRWDNKVLMDAVVEIPDVLFKQKKKAF
ncbi:hypothetical protein [Ferruginibacter sp.]|uniref:hypothetical protein n=1 Tax=Ferruginibacter sp. TaxID=1940288 RepID=UPI00265ADB1D|nr:hypothetical protein [Ferruginibacter sp.]